MAIQVSSNLSSWKHRTHLISSTATGPKWSSCYPLSCFFFFFPHNWYFLPVLEISSSYLRIPGIKRTNLRESSWSGQWTWVFVECIVLNVCGKKVTPSSRLLLLSMIKGKLLLVSTTAYPNTSFPSWCYEWATGVPRHGSSYAWVPIFSCVLNATTSETLPSVLPFLLYWIILISMIYATTSPR